MARTTHRLFPRNAIVRWKRPKQMRSRLQREHLASLRKEHGVYLFKVMRRLKAAPGSAHPQRLLLVRTGVRPYKEFRLLDNHGRHLPLNGIWFERILP